MKLLNYCNIRFPYRIKKVRNITLNIFDHEGKKL